MQSKQGGDANQVPNHLNDLTIWNMCATKTAVNGGGTLPGNGEFDWWRMGWKYWKILPPVVVGFHGASVKFVKEQVKLMKFLCFMFSCTKLYVSGSRNLYFPISKRIAL